MIAKLPVQGPCSQYNSVFILDSPPTKGVTFLWYIGNWILRYDFSWQCIDIDAALSQDLDTVVAIDDRSIWPHFE